MPQAGMGAGTNLQRGARELVPLGRSGEAALPLGDQDLELLLGGQRLGLDGGEGVGTGGSDLVQGALRLHLLLKRLCAFLSPPKEGDDRAGDLLDVALA